MGLGERLQHLRERQLRGVFQHRLPAHLRATRSRYLSHVRLLPGLSASLWGAL